MTTTILINPNTIIPFRTGRVAFDAMGDRLFAEYKVELGADDDDDDLIIIHDDDYDDDSDDDDDDALR